jgi:hypothetical protein
LYFVVAKTFMSLGIMFELMRMDICDLVSTAEPLVI